jgi:hypothetical protein
MKWVACLLMWIPAVASAQPIPVPPPPTILIHPAGEPVPALKYRIMPERLSLISGNASVFYHRAIQFLYIRRKNQPPAERNAPPSPSYDELVYTWASNPIREIPLDQARTVLEQYGTLLHETELGATRTFCDWEFDQRKEGFSLLLADIQEMRTIGRLVALRARVAVLEGKTDEAFHWIETGFVVARHVSQGSTLIQSLVGCAIESNMAMVLEDLIQAPGTPSLYWALAIRPRPLIDMTAPLESERYILERELPALRDLETGPWTLAKTRKFSDDLRSGMGSWGEITLLASPGNPPTISGTPPQLRAFSSQLALAAMVARNYPEARKSLIASGKPVEEVDAMPTLQVVMLEVYRSYIAYCDDVYKWAALPYRVSSQKSDVVVRDAVVRAKLSNPLLAPFMMLVPALNSARFASLRVDRRLDAIQCIEAIRLYAAAHDGAFPPTLEAITEAPAPFDPATGKPFDYKVNGDTASLTGPLPVGAPDHYTSLIRYELKLAK